MSTVVDELSRQLDQSLLRDRAGLRHRLDKARARLAAGKPADKLLSRLEADLLASCKRVEQRRAAVPVVDYPPELPVAEKRETIREALDRSRVVVVAGETGSGKTTQLPKICLEAGRGVLGTIGHTQPRRIAARTVASRIAEELGTPLGEQVGYQVRFTDHSGDNTLIKLMTDGILLAEIQHDPLFERYDTLIIDEAHERSLNIDFLLGYIKKVLPRRPDLKVIITSATIDVERFSRHFDDAPVVSVSGRTYPVEVRYRPPAESDEDVYEALVSGVEELLAEPKRGDILVFLSGEREIREAAAALRRAQLPHLEVMPLYARLSLAEQSRIFQPHKGTRVVLATNVAETSLTVPGIRYVIDTGYARISRYSYRTKVQRLPIEPIARASANQRAGRCGRQSDGVCLRLYSEEDFESRPEFTDPEIVRTNLAAVILRMLQMRIGDIRDFPFVDPPDKRLINDGFQLLSELRAVSGNERLTETGRLLGKLPVDPRLGKMLASAGGTALREVLIIVAALSIQDPRERPAEKRQAADEKHARWRDSDSDFAALLNLWNHFEEQRQALSRNQFSKYCHANFVSYRRMREWRDLEHQLRLACREQGLKENHQPADYERVHKALLSGLLTQVGQRQEGREYLGARNRKFLIFPGSGVGKKKPPPWIMAAELLETSRLFAHQVARIEPDWIPPLAEHLIKRHHNEPYYDRKRGQVMAFERQTLFGLTVVERKRVLFAAIDPAAAREVFIQGALVENRYRGRGAFARHNRELLEELEGLEDRLRERGILPEDDELYRFYDERVPEDICTLKGFEKWRREAEEDNPDLLFLNRDTLMARAHLQQAGEQFPGCISWQGTEYELDYRFEPGHEEDGVSVIVPVPLLHQVPGYRFQWLVPGLLRDKCIALVKALPKQYRKQFVPVPDYVDRALAGMEPDNVPLGEALGFQLKRHTGIDIPAQAWREGDLDDFYRVTYRLVDEGGEVIAREKDLSALKERFRETVRRTIDEASPDNEGQENITRWTFGKLEPVRRIPRGDLEIEVYPGLVDEGAHVALRMFDDDNDACWHSLRGVTRLFILHHGEPARYLRKQVFRGRALELAAADFSDPEGLREALIFAAYGQACLGEDFELPRTETDFQQCLARGRSDIVRRAQAMEKVILDLLEPLRNIRGWLSRYEERGQYPDSLADARQQLNFLFRPDFLFEAEAFWLEQYPRYLRALEMRLEKLPAQSRKDEAFAAEVSELLADAEAVAERPGGCPPQCRRALEEFRWLIQEYRVSFFAQVLKTVKPVSGKRLRRRCREIHALAAGGRSGQGNHVAG